MIRVPGEAELYVDVDWSARTVRLFGPSKESLLWLIPTASAMMRLDLLGAEFRLEGVPGVQDWSRSGMIGLQLDAGYITVVGRQITAVQSQNLRSLLERAETVLRTGIGDMTTP